VTKAIAVLAVAGTAISIYLTWVHYAGIEPICTGVSDCERVQNSDYASLAGVPVALIGVFGYLAILASLRLPPESTALFAYIGVGFSAYLTWAELFRIDAVCQWCVASAIVITAIAVLASVRAVRAARGPSPRAVQPQAR